MMAKCKRVTKLSNKIDLYSGLQKDLIGTAKGFSGRLTFIIPK